MLNAVLVVVLDATTPAHGSFGSQRSVGLFVGWFVAVAVSASSAAAAAVLWCSQPDNNKARLSVTLFRVREKQADSGFV